MFTKEEYTKEEFYKDFIGMQKLSGQGSSGIIKVQGGPVICEYIDEFIKEGLAVMMDTGGSLGHPESNRFYLPSKGYNVWQEENTLASLECVRYYLAKLENPNKPYKGDPFLGINDESFEQGGYLSEFYTEWLKRNKESLDEMMNLSDVYPVCCS
jgi:hypothetical protein